MAVVGATPGCSGYRIGTASLYPADIRTVYVPVFESNSFRRNLGERLTEAVAKEIDNRTPYKVVGSAQADSVLAGTILRDTKRVLVEDPNDEVREGEINFEVQVQWVDRRGDLIRGPQTIAMPVELTEIGRAASYVPEVGQSIATAQQKAIERLARQIVSMMEAPW